MFSRILCRFSYFQGKCGFSAFLSFWVKIAYRGVVRGGFRLISGLFPVISGLFPVNFPGNVFF